MILLVVYVVIAALVFVGAVAAALELDGDERAKAARIAIASPAWPLLLVRAIQLGFRLLAKTASGRTDQ